MANPIPRLAPVTTAVVPVRSKGELIARPPCPAWTSTRIFMARPAARSSSAVATSESGTVRVMRASTGSAFDRSSSTAISKSCRW